MKITKIFGREILDSRGIPTVECILTLSNGSQVSASVPSGLTKGLHEAFELRDGGSRYGGNGTLKAVEHLNTTIHSLLAGREPNVVQSDIKMLQFDDTDNKSRLGANAILAASMAVARAQALCEGLKLYEFIAYICGFNEVVIPSPMLNLINGGRHADSNLQIQEFMVIPIGMSNFRTAIEVSVAIFRALVDLLRKEKRKVAFGDEGGIVSDFRDDAEALEFLHAAITHVEGSSEGNVMIALDVAASQFYDARHNRYRWQGEHITAHELIHWYKNLMSRYPIYSIEDGLSEVDIEGWKEFSRSLGSQVHIVGDDIFATNSQRIWNALEEGIANTAIIKPNQVGTLTEALQAVKLCKENGFSFIVSHRSGETNDAFIADLAVGTSSGHIKAGGCTRGERIAKYNRILEIEDELLLV